jgi:hypothetical protein
MKPLICEELFILPLMRNSSQVYSWPKLLDMTPFPISHLGHNNQALTKRFVYQGTRSNIRALPKPKSQATRLKYANGVMTSRIGCTTNQPFGMHLRHVHVPASSCLLASSLGAKFPQPQGRSPILIWAYARKFYLSPAIWQLYLLYTNFSWYNLLEIFVMIERDIQEFKKK